MVVKDDSSRSKFRQILPMPFFFFTKFKVLLADLSDNGLATVLI
jgi:hypothetical protein